MIFDMSREVKTSFRRLARNSLNKVRLIFPRGETLVEKKAKNKKLEIRVSLDRTTNIVGEAHDQFSNFCSVPLGDILSPIHRNHLNMSEIPAPRVRCVVEIHHGLGQ